MALRSRLWTLSLLTAALAACSPYVEGNGVYAERTFDAGSGLRPFDAAVIGFPSSVDVNGQPLAASIFVDPAAAPQVVLGGDENVIQDIQVQADEGEVLHTTTNRSYHAVHPPQLRITAPQLVSVGSIGGAGVTVAGAAAASFAVTAEAGGRVELSGAGGARLTAILSGGAQLDASAYPVSSAVLTLGGGSSVTVAPSSLLSGSADGGSVVKVKADATTAAALCQGVVLGAGSTCGPL